MLGDMMSPMNTTLDVEETCLNCEAPLTGPYCSQCGQKDEREIPTLWSMIGELVGDVLELDSRIWRTLRLLVARPGALTAEYLAGRRVRYLPPLRLFMATGIVMLLVYSVSGDSPLRAGLEVDAAGDADAVEVEVPEDAGFWDRFAATVEARVSADPEGVQEAFGENLPRMMFLFLPLAAAMLMVLYLGSGRRYIEHLVFSIHAHAFVFLELATARSIRTWALGEDTLVGTFVGLGVVVWTLAYFFLALRRVYGQGRLVTSIKFVVLVGGYWVLLILMLVLTAIATIFLA